MSAAPDLKSLDPAALAAYFASLGEPAYRARQAMRWMYQHDEPDPERWTDLPAELRRRLAAEAVVTVLAERRRQVSAVDRTAKFLFGLSDGATVEGVAIFSGRRMTVCFSTQVGCALGCRFCATGLGGFVRDLTAGEMVDQVLRARAYAAAAEPAAALTNAVAMGQGEPFRAYDALMAALRIMNSADGLGLGARRITVSTCGVIEGIDRLAREPEQFGLAVSLHAARQSVRDALMPGVRRWPLAALRAALVRYTEATGRRVTLEYALLAGVNDSRADLDALRRFCRGLLCYVNLIPANPVEGAAHDRSPADRARAFCGGLKMAGVEASVRTERGADIDAACGQLRQREV